LKVAGLRLDIRMHLLRHAHASWLLNGGADLMVVKERLASGRADSASVFTICSAKSA
jgi:site-specific recombinase XerD